MPGTWPNQSMYFIRLLSINLSNMSQSIFYNHCFSLPKFCTMVRNIYHYTICICTHVHCHIQILIPACMYAHTHTYRHTRAHTQTHTEKCATGAHSQARLRTRTQTHTGMLNHNIHIKAPTHRQTQLHRLAHSHIQNDKGAYTSTGTHTH